MHRTHFADANTSAPRDEAALTVAKILWQKPSQNIRPVFSTLQKCIETSTCICDMFTILIHVYLVLLSNQPDDGSELMWNVELVVGTKCEQVDEHKLGNP